MARADHFQYIASKRATLTNLPADQIALLGDQFGYPDCGFNGLPMNADFIKYIDHLSYDKVHPLSAEEICPLYWNIRGFSSNARVNIPIISQTDTSADPPETFTNTNDYDDRLTDPEFGDGLLVLDSNTIGYFPNERAQGLGAGKVYAETGESSSETEEDENGNDVLIDPLPWRGRIEANFYGPQTLTRIFQNGYFQGYGMQLGTVFVEASNQSNQASEAVSKRITLSSFFPTALQDTDLTFGEQEVTYELITIGDGIPIWKETVEIENVDPSGDFGTGYITDSMVTLNTFNPLFWDY
tara:strand:+ start:80 stop:973 length:894 start_codon:yes stop_codon:yes gene_type:complete